MAHVAHRPGVDGSYGLVRGEVVFRPFRGAPPSALCALYRPGRFSDVQRVLRDKARGRVLPRPQVPAEPAVPLHRVLQVGGDGKVSGPVDALREEAVVRSLQRAGCLAGETVGSPAWHLSWRAW